MNRMKWISDFRSALVAIALVMFQPAALHSQQKQEPTHVAMPHISCIHSWDLEDALTYMDQEDDAAVEQMVASDRCGWLKTSRPDGGFVEVFVVAVEKGSPPWGWRVKIRPVGSTLTLWTVQAAVAHIPEKLRP